MVIDMREWIDGHELGGMMGDTEGGVEEQNADRKDRWEQAVRNSSAIGMSLSRVREVSSLQVRILTDCC